MKNVTKTSISVPTEILKKAREKAEADGRTLSNYITMLLLRELK